MSDPTWLLVARKLVGTREFPGTPSNPKIMGWANRVGAKALGIPYAGDHVPWCGLGVAYCMVEAGHKPPAIAIRAKSWATWGRACPKPLVGAVAVFDRAGGGHVGFVVGVYRNGDLAILGFNQGDAVNVRRFSAERLVKDGLRWPATAPMIGLFVQLKEDGTPVSRNEA